MGRRSVRNPPSIGDSRESLYRLRFTLVRFWRIALPAGKTALITIGIALQSCGAGSSDPPVFVAGRGVYAEGDSLLAFTIASPPALLVVDRAAGSVDTLGRGHLVSPVHVQRSGNRWFVSDVREDGPLIAVLRPDGAPDRIIDVADLSPTPHQFAVLPDQRVVVIGRGQRLIARSEKGTEVFALTEAGTRPSQLVAASGGVLHAVPGQHITLYNGFGHIRWRVDWPWAESAYVSDLSLDAQGRIHVLAGVVREKSEFITYTMVPTTGEVVRWSQSSPANTFTVSRFGEVTADTTLAWLR